MSSFQVSAPSGRDKSGEESDLSPCLHASLPHPLQMAIVKLPGLEAWSSRFSSSSQDQPGNGRSKFPSRFWVSTHTPRRPGTLSFREWGFLSPRMTLRNFSRVNESVQPMLHQNESNEPFLQFFKISAGTGERKATLVSHLFHPSACLSLFPPFETDS